MNPLDALIDVRKEEAQGQGIEYTPMEIAHQAKYWPDTLERVKSLTHDLHTQIAKAGCLPRGTGRVILTGAGSSDYVGRSLANLFREKWKVPADAYPTTDILVHPTSFFAKDRPTLLISFARSGNSPESVAVFDLANQICDKVAHIVVTCNAEGALAKRVQEHPEKGVAVVFHPNTNDRGLAMTASFTNMLIAGQAIAHLADLAQYKRTLQDMVALVDRQLTEGATIAQQLAERDFDRAIFLGNGTLSGIAAESALKLQELTDGKVMTNSHSFLGLRHGPEAVVNERTLVVYYVSKDPYVRQYEIDLIKQILEKQLTSKKIAIGTGLAELVGLVDIQLDLAANQSTIVSDMVIGAVYVIFGQLLGLFKALNVGTKPDYPSERGAIHRVVQGVQIYPFQG